MINDVVIQDGIDGVLVCEPQLTCNSPVENCSAPMESPSMCERKHVQKPDQPIDYMKVEVKVGPLGDPNESFVLHSLRSSPALMGFDVNGSS